MYSVPAWPPTGHSSLKPEALMTALPLCPVVLHNAQGFGAFPHGVAGLGDFACAGAMPQRLILYYFMCRITYRSSHSPKAAFMSVSAKDVISLSQARTRLSEIADEVKSGVEKIITKNGESYVALIDADRLDYYHRLERERIHLLLLDEAEKGLADVAAGRVKDARKLIRRLKAKRKAA